MAGARHPRRPPAASIPGFQASAEPARGTPEAGEALVRRRLTLAELLADARESERLTRETMWLQEMNAVGIEID